MLFSSLLFAPALAFAPDPASVADARCYVAIAVLLAQAEDKDQDALATETLFFLGKLAARNQPKDIKLLIDAEVEKMMPDDAPAIALKCNEQLTAANEALKD